MRKRDWARIFGILCIVAAIGLSVANYGGAQWDALILMLGALMLLRAAVEWPSPTRVEGLSRALRVVLFMFAFAAVNRAQGGVDGAVAAAIGNRVLWAVAALLFILPMLRKGVPQGSWRELCVDVALLAGLGVVFWFIHSSSEPSEDMAMLRTLVWLAVLSTADTFWPVRDRPLIAGLAWGVGATVVITSPGDTVWIAASGALPVTVAIFWLRGRRASPPAA